MIFFELVGAEMSTALVKQVFKSDARSIARLISIVENDMPEAHKLMAQIYPKSGRAHIIGITGPPGVGKSTIVNKLTKVFRANTKTVGIIAVDPTSPYTGGALLGDRIRMQELCSDKGVFIRSMATRGCMGGLAKATKDVIKILDASGKDVILIETVGAGQSEVDIIKYAHTAVVIQMPGLGDDIQAIKAGVLEIGDIFVINKADRDGVERAIVELDTMLDLNPHKVDWKPPIIKMIARDNKGLDELYVAIGRHLNYLKTSGVFELKLKEQYALEFKEVLQQNLSNYIMTHLINQDKFDEFVERIIKRQIDPYSASNELLSSILNETPEKIRKIRVKTK